MQEFPNVCCCPLVDSAMPSAAIVARLDISERCADNVRNLVASRDPRAAVARVLAKAARAVEAQTSAIVVDRSVIDDLIALVGKRGHLSHVSRSSGGIASARAVEAEPAEPEEGREIQHVWALTVSLRHFWTSVGRFVCLRQPPISRLTNLVTC